MTLNDGKHSKMSGSENHGILGTAFADISARNAYSVTADDLATGIVRRVTSTGRDYVAITTGAGAGSWRLVGDADAAAVATNTSNIATNTSDIATETSARTTADGLKLDKTATLTAGANVSITGTNLGTGLTISATSSELVADLATSGVPASYTAGGTTGAETLTFVGNPLADGVAPSDGDTILLAYNDTTTHLAGLFTKSGGGTAVWTRKALFNTAAVLGSSRVRVLGGMFNAGRVYIQSLKPSAITIGTTPWFWRVSGQIPQEHGFQLDQDWTSRGSTIAVTSVPIQSFGGYTVYGIGAGSTPDIIATNNTGNVFGELELDTGTTSTGASGVYVGEANWGLSRADIAIDMKFMLPTASDGTNTYAFGCGIGPTDASNFMAIKVTSLTASLAMEIAVTVATVSGTPVSLGTNFTAGVYYRLVLIKKAFTTTYDVWFDDGTGAGLILKGTTAAAAPTAQVIAGMTITKSLGATARLARQDWFRVRYYDPLARKVN